TVRAEDSPATHMDPNEVRVWLEARGFELREQGPSWLVLVHEDADAFLVVEEGELAKIILTFTLTRDSPSRWRIWQALVEDMCEKWGLILYDSNTGSMVDGSEVLRVLGETQAWKDFESNFDWPPAGKAGTREKAGT